MAEEDNGLSPDLADELLSINAIYGPTTLRRHSSGGDIDINGAVTMELRPPTTHPLHPTSLLLCFPMDYPSAPPRVLGPATSDPAAAKGAAHAAAQHAQKVLDSVHVPEEPVVFALLAELETTILQQGSHDDANEDGEVDMDADHETSTPPPTQGLADSQHATTLSEPDGVDADADASRFALAHWTTAPPLESHRSVFVGRAIRVATAADVAAATAALRSQDRHVARATHNIRAWRYRGLPLQASATGKLVEHQECDDDGETRAGAKVLEVLSAMGVWDVLVVVSRWYGGVKLGPERFRLIGQSARDVLVLGGWGPSNKAEEGKKGRKKGK